MGGGPSFAADLYEMHCEQMVDRSRNMQYVQYVVHTVSSM